MSPRTLSGVAAQSCLALLGHARRRLAVGRALGQRLRRPALLLSRLLLSRLMLRGLLQGRRLGLARRELSALATGLVGGPLLEIEPLRFLLGFGGWLVVAGLASAAGVAGFSAGLAVLAGGLFARSKAFWMASLRDVGCALWPSTSSTGLSGVWAPTGCGVVTGVWSMTTSLDAAGGALPEGATVVSVMDVSVRFWRARTRP
jgi:hypothetical protein